MELDEDGVISHLVMPNDTPYYLVDDYPNIRVKVIKDDEDRIVKIYDGENTDIIYANIEYNDLGDIIFYSDYMGNWYDRRYCKYPSPFDDKDVVKSPYIWAPFITVTIPNIGTVGTELVPEVPMGMPTGTLHYLDYVYEQPAVVEEEVASPIMTKYATKKVNNNFYGSISTT